MPRSETPDYNPDKDGHVEHRYVVQPAWKSGTYASGILAPDGRYLKYNREKRLMVKDEKLAREIQQQHRNDLVVTRVRYPGEADRGHRYFFGQMPAMPWHQYDENGKRIDNVDTA